MSSMIVLEYVGSFSEDPKTKSGTKKKLVSSELRNSRPLNFMRFLFRIPVSLDDVKFVRRRREAAIDYNLSTMTLISFEGDNNDTCGLILVSCSFVLLKIGECVETNMLIIAL